jgi:hypothetical protein
MIELTLGAAWLWDKHGDSIIEWLQERAKDKGQEISQSAWQKFKWREAEQNYKTKSLELYGWTRILGNPEPTELSGIFTDLYILSRPLATRRYSIDQLHDFENEKLHGKELDRRNGVNFVKQQNSRRLFVLGKPGAGKTTFLRYINLQTVQGHIAKTPIFITLREWTDTDKPLMAFIAEQFSICGFPEADSFIEFLLEKGLAIVLFDGLDEVNQAHNPRIISEIKNFCRRYDKSQCLITCRVAAVDYSFENFNYVEVADFTDDQITAFVTKWFKCEPKKGEQFLLDLKEQQHRGLSELASSPLLLGMLCLAFADSMKFPARRAELYADAIDALLRKWDSSRSIKRDDIYKNLTRRLKEQLFAAIAYKTFSENKYLLPEKELSGYLAVALKKLPTQEDIPEADIVLKAIEAQHGIFVERAQKIHSFAHLTFQEYFAANHIAANAKLHAELLKHITEPRWREVILLTASLLNDADDFFSAFSDLIIKADKQPIEELLQWANTKTLQINTPFNTPYRRLAINAFYIALDIALKVAINSDLENGIDLERARAQNLSRDRNLNLDLILSLADEQAFYQARSFIRTFNINIDIYFLEFDSNFKVFECADDLAIHSKDMACDYLITINLLVTLRFLTTDYFTGWIVKSYDNFVSFFLKSVHQLSDWGFINFAQQLTELISIFPSKTAPQIQWKFFSNKLQKILQTQRDIAHDWQLSTVQLETLTNYLAVNLFLLECLNLATVTDREAIKNNLLPPNATRPRSE